MTEHINKLNECGFLKSLGNDIDKLQTWPPALVKLDFVPYMEVSFDDQVTKEP